MYKNKHVHDLVLKYEIDLDSTNEQLKCFLLEFSPVVEAHGYPKIESDKLFVYKCYMEKFGLRGRTHYSPDGTGIILIFTEFFHNWLNHSPERKQYVLYGYIQTLIHELAHYICEPFIEKHKLDDHCYYWKNCARILGYDTDYFS